MSNRAGVSFLGLDRPLAATANAAASPVVETRRAFATDDEMLTAVMSAVAQDEPLLRAHQLHDTLGQLSSSELSVLFGRAVKITDPERRGPLLDALLVRWVAVDREAARSAVRPYLQEFRTLIRIDWRSMEAAVNNAWAAAVPEETLADAMASTNPSWARYLAEVALTSLSEGDPARQLETLTHLPEGRLRSELCVTAIKALAEKDCPAAEAQLHLISDPRTRARVHAEILGALATRDPAAGLARLEELAPNLSTDTSGIQLATGILRAASKKDHEAALAAADGLPEGLRRTALGSVLVGWADQNPVDALAWAAANGVDISEAKGNFSFGETSGMSWQTLVMVAFGRDKDKTLDWLRAQPSSPERDSMLRDGLWNGTLEQQLAIYAELTPAGQLSAAGDLAKTSLRYGKIGADRIEAWAKALAPGPARMAAIRELADHQAGSAPERIDELANAWPPGPDRDASLRGISSSLADENPQRALEFARQINDSSTREAAFEKIAQSWFDRDKSATRAWVIGTTELTSEQKRVLLRQADDR